MVNNSILSNRFNVQLNTDFIVTYYKLASNIDPVGIDGTEYDSRNLCNTAISLGIRLSY
jgi:hypothetical protein